MAHSGGFEPPTARFVAEYSIQLSYECIIEVFGAEQKQEHLSFFSLNLSKQK